MAARRNYTEEDVRGAVASSLSTAESLRRLGLRAAGGNRLTLKKLIERYGLSTAHFDPHRVQRTHLGARPGQAVERDPRRGLDLSPRAPQTPAVRGGGEGPPV